MFNPASLSEYFAPNIEPKISPKYDLNRLLDAAHHDRERIPYKTTYSYDFFTHTDSRVRLDPFAAKLQNPKDMRIWRGHQYRSYSGLLHSHTADSDGKGTPKEAFRVGRDVAKLDFMAVTDHAEMLTGNSGAEKWKQAHQTAEEFRTPQFVPFVGFEYSHLLLGHFVVLGTPDFRSSLTDTSLAEFREWLDGHSGQKPLVIFAHPGFHEYRNATEFSHFHNSAILGPYLIGLEVIHHNDFRHYLNGYSRKYPYIDEALIEGLMVGGFGSQDNHSDSWGIQDSVRTVIYADQLSEAAINEALVARRYCATNNENLTTAAELRTKSGDWVPMGTRLRRSDLDSEVAISFRWIDFAGRVPPNRIEIISEGHILDKIDFPIIPETSDSGLFASLDDTNRINLQKKYSDHARHMLEYEPKAGQFTASIHLPESLGRKTYFYVRFFQGYDSDFFTQTAPFFIDP